MEEFTAVCWRDLPRAAVFPRGGGKYNPDLSFFVFLFQGSSCVRECIFSRSYFSLFFFFFSFKDIKKL